MNVGSIQTGYTTSSIANTSGSAGLSETQTDNEYVKDTIRSYPELAHKKDYELTSGEEVYLKIVEKANKMLNGAPRRFDYSIHQSGEVVVKIIDTETNELIREIPPEKLVELVSNLQKLLGAIIDEKR